MMTAAFPDGAAPDDISGVQGGYHSDEFKRQQVEVQTFMAPVDAMTANASQVLGMIAGGDNSGPGATHTCRVLLDDIKLPIGFVQQHCQQMVETKRLLRFLVTLVIYLVFLNVVFGVHLGKHWVQTYSTAVHDLRLDKLEADWTSLYLGQAANKYKNTTLPLVAQRVQELCPECTVKIDFVRTIPSFQPSNNHDPSLLFALN
jgi:hypothetical protein